MSRRTSAIAGGGLLLLLALPMSRHWLEANMARHMLLQFPLLFCAGWLSGRAWPVRAAAWNRHGIAGLLLVSCVLAFWMVPRALDLVLTMPWLEAAKFASLFAAGAALALSWPAADLLVRGFFLGNLLPMTAVTGWLYLAAPLRLCNAYLTGQQEVVGRMLLVASLLAACLWLAGFFFGTSRTNEYALNC